MTGIRFIFADVQDLVGPDERAALTGFIGKWIRQMADRHPKRFKSLEITWATGAGRPNPRKTGILVYVTGGPERSIIEADGGNVNQAIVNTQLLGLTAVDAAARTALSEVYFDRKKFLKEVAGAAFHEAAHNKSLQDNQMHGEGGLLKEFPDYASDPTGKNLDFFAKHVLEEVTQTIVPQSKLKRWWYTGRP